MGNRFLHILHTGALGAVLLIGGFLATEYGVSALGSEPYIGATKEVYAKERIRLQQGGIAAGGVIMVLVGFTLLRASFRDANRPH